MSICLGIPGSVRICNLPADITWQSLVDAIDGLGFGSQHLVCELPEVQFLVDYTSLAGTLEQASSVPTVSLQYLLTSVESYSSIVGVRGMHFHS